ncbi:hypothetical protein NH340_JMT07392 [Sarcoptes scabiei]|nr:hypothetical protein NH340_JMT07392 [Sarcoptes scabiei]
MFVRRPNPNDTEDDLLNQQEQFLKESHQKYEHKKTKAVCSLSSEIEDDPNSKPTADKDAHYMFDDFQFSIVEHRKCDDSNEKRMIDAETGFPRAFEVERTSETRSKTKNISLYMKSKMKHDNETNQDENNDGFKTPNVQLISGIGLGCSNWQSEMEKIRQSNRKIIDGMSREEIEKARAEIIKKLNPKVCEFLRSKKFSIRSEVKNLSQSSETTEIKPAKNDVDDLEEIECKIPISLDEIKSKKYLNMSVIEKEKLEWIGTLNDQDEKKVDQNRSSHAADLSDLDARFDFEGQLLYLNDRTKEIDTLRQGLHHHGDQQEKPGYTIQELLIYLQSSFPSQKQLALQVFSKIIIKCYSGFYDECFNQNLIEYLLQSTQLVLIVRKCLDETNDSIWKCAIHTIKTLICNTVFDELFLDRGFLILEDFLDFGFKIDINLKPELEKEIDDETTDEQYLALDVIECLLKRTSLLQRLSYLLNNQLNDSDDDTPFVENILDIFLRIARHSKESCREMLTSSAFLDAIFSRLMINRISIEKINNVHVKIFKFIRIGLDSIKDQNSLTSDLLERFIEISLLDSINHSFLLVPEDVQSERNERIVPMVSLEALRLWLKLITLIKTNSIDHDFGLRMRKNFEEMFPFFVKILSFCKRLNPTDSFNDSIRSTFDFQFASCFFMLLTEYHQLLESPEDFAPIYCFDLYDISMQWLQTINNESIVPNFDSNIALLILIEFVLKHLNLSKENLDRFNQLTLTKLVGGNEIFRRKLFRLLRNNSNFNVNFKGEKIIRRNRDSINLPSYGSIYFQGRETIPLFNNQSPICLLLGLLKIVINDDFIASNLSMTSSCDYLLDYVDFVSQNLDPSTQCNIFDLFELNVVSQACLAIRKTLDHIDGPAFDCCESISTYKRDKIFSIIFDFALMANVLNANQIKNDLIEKCLFSLFNDTRIRSARKTYLECSKFDHQLWIFDCWLPKLNDTEKKYSIKLEQLITSLDFIDFLVFNHQKYFDRITISSTNLFEIISTIFLINEEFFFDRKISTTLERILRQLISFKIECLKEDRVPFIGSIVDV